MTPTVRNMIIIFVVSLPSEHNAVFTNDPTVNLTQATENVWRRNDHKQDAWWKMRYKFVGLKKSIFFNIYEWFVCFYNRHGKNFIKSWIKMHGLTKKDYNSKMWETPNFSHNGGHHKFGRSISLQQKYD